jgi:hypothetical protein
LYRRGLNRESRSRLLIIKEWPLARKFSKLEYSPDIHHFWRIQVLAKMAFFRNVSDSPDSPTFAKPCCTDSPDSLPFANLFCSDSPDSPTFAKGHFLEKCDSPRHICTSNERVSRIWGEWPLFTYNTRVDSLADQREALCRCQGHAYRIENFENIKLCTNTPFILCRNSI